MAEYSKKQIEEIIKNKLIEIHDLYKKFNPDGDYLDLSIWNDSLMFTNGHNVENHMRIDYFERR